MTEAADLQERFRRDGVVHIPGVLSAETLAKAERAWRWSIENAGPFASRLYTNDLASVTSEAAARLIDHPERGFFYQDLGNPHAREIYRGVKDAGEITAALGTLFAGENQTSNAWFIGEQVFLKEGGERTGWHQDAADLGCEGLDAVTVWMCFDPVDAAHSLEVVRGSHLGPVYSSIYGSFRAADIPAIESNRDEWDIVSYACSPGDVVIFHVGTLHGGGATRDGETRRSLALRYVGDDCHIAPWSASRKRPAGSPFHEHEMSERVL